MYFEDDDDLIAVLDQSADATQTPPLDQIADGVMDYDATFALINRYQGSSPYWVRLHKGT